MRVGAGALTDAELLALVLGAGSPGQNVVSWSAALLREADGFAGLLSMDAARLQQLRGIGPATAGRLVAAGEMWRRANSAERVSRLSDSASIARIVLAELSHRSIERFLVLVAGRDLRVREVVALREGGDHSVHVDSREVLSAVLSRGGAVFAVAHNHPGERRTRALRMLRSRQRCRVRPTRSVFGFSITSWSRAQSGAASGSQLMRRANSALRAACGSAFARPNDFARSRSNFSLARKNSPTSCP